MRFARHLNQAMSQAWVEHCVTCWQEDLAFAYMIQLKASGAWLGSIELMVRTDVAEIGYILSDSFWGQGFATEAARVLVAWAEMQPGLGRIVAVCHSDNLASRRVLEKIGLQFEARLDGDVLWPQLRPANGARLLFGCSLGPESVISSHQIPVKSVGLHFKCEIAQALP